MFIQLSFFDEPHGVTGDVHQPGEFLIDSAAARKARGAFFTPQSISAFLARWAVRAADDSVLEPSCGEAAFLIEAGHVLRKLGAPASQLRKHLHGMDVHAPSAARAEAMLEAVGMHADIRVGDFLAEEPRPAYDAVIGNPPFIRYQQFAGAARARSLEAALRQGVRLTGLTNSWAAFVIQATQFIKPTGRLGLVLPAELLSVNYANEVRQFLLRRFGSVRLVAFDELVFPGVLEDVVLLLAEGEGPSNGFHVHQARDATALNELTSEGWLGFVPEVDGKWTPALLPSGVYDTFREITAGDSFSSLLRWGETSLGTVTGNNKFFAITAQKARELELPSRELTPISPPGSRHLRGFGFSQRAWEEQSVAGAACHLFTPKEKNPSGGALRYIADGEAAGVHLSYKCRMRNPWWKVPMRKVSDLLLTYMDHERPRLVSNEAGVHHLNSLYGVSLRHGLKEIGRDLLPIAMLNSVTMLASEIAGRTYGGGLLKLEPNEADRLFVPSEAVLKSLGSELRSLKPQLASALRSGDLLAAVTLVDRELLMKRLGIPATALQQLRTARSTLFSRRVARGRTVNAKR